MTRSPTCIYLGVGPSSVYMLVVQSSWRKAINVRAAFLVIIESAQGHFVNGCHGNTEIHICTEFHLHASYSFASSEAK